MRAFVVVPFVGYYYAIPGSPIGMVFMMPDIIMPSPAASSIHVPINRVQ
jgi:hypothetical protein